MNTTKITPIKISTGAMALIFSPMRKLVTVVPMLAPMMIYTDCSSLSSPALRKPDHHDGGGRGGLDGPGDHHAHQNAQQWVGGDFLQQPLEAGARHQLQAVAISFMPNRNIPSPPSRVNTCV